jgi:predicted nucleotidyltransferase
MGATDEAKPAEIQFYGGYQVYVESGVDLTLLHAQLHRSIEDRWEANHRHVAFCAEFRQPGQEKADRRNLVFDAAAMVRCLSAEGVDFVVIGALAMIARGSAYVTEDLDVCYNRATENVANLAAALAPIHAYVRGARAGSPSPFDPSTMQSGLNFTLTTDHGDIDLIGEVSGIGNYDQVLVQSGEMAMYGLKVQVLSIDGLIAAKKACGRTKDKLHLLELEELKKILDAAPQQEKP